MKSIPKVRQTFGVHFKKQSYGFFIFDISDIPGVIKNSLFPKTERGNKGSPARAVVLQILTRQRQVGRLSMPSVFHR